jgi:murein DD-endopeptidase MepM/ murein hydrolase activator NlpD
LEFVVLGIATLAVIANFSLIRHANTVTANDESVIFSFLKNNPKLNNALLAQSDTTTIVAKSDQLVSKAMASEVLLTSSQTSSPAVNPTTIQDDVIMKTNPADTQNFYRHGLTQYKVQPGDTLIGIASSFGISPATIMKENKMDQSSTLKPGQELTILPTTGITYTIKDGDTQESILNKYKVSEDAFLDANNLESFEDLDSGAVVVIPMDNVTVPAAPKPASKFVKSDSGKVSLKTASAPSNLLSSAVSFVWPTSVRNITQGYSSRHTGLDISDSKKEPIYASADGFVEISGYQSNGYGNTIVINHGNGFKTRYGHASELYVSAGDYVTQGQLIAKQGNTGRVRGATGIHLHFEIIKNGKRVNPLSYVRP